MSPLNFSNNGSDKHQEAARVADVPNAIRALQERLKGMAERSKILVSKLTGTPLPEVTAVPPELKVVLPDAGPPVERTEPERITPQPVVKKEVTPPATKVHVPVPSAQPIPSQVLPSPSRNGFHHKKIAPRRVIPKVEDVAVPNTNDVTLEDGEIVADSATYIL